MATVPRPKWTPVPKTSSRAAIFLPEGIRIALAGVALAVSGCTSCSTLPARPDSGVEQHIAASDGQAQDTDANVGVDAVEELAPIEEPATVSLVKALGSQDTNEQLAAIQSLEDIGRPAADLAIPALDKVVQDGNGPAKEALFALSAMGPQAVPTLVRALGNEDLRWYAVRSLGSMGADAKGAVPALSDLLVSRDVSESDRRCVGEALGEIGPEGIAALLRHAESLMGETRIAVAVGLAESKSPPPNVLAALRKLLQDPDPDVREATLDASGKLRARGEPLVPDLVAALRDPQAHLRMDAARALAKIGEPSVPALIATLGDRDPDVRRLGAIALKLIGPSAAEAVTALQSATHDDHAGVRFEAENALSAITESPSALDVEIGP